MQTYKEVVAKFKEKNSKIPKTTWRYESWGDSYEQGGRVGLKDGTSKKQLSFDFKAKKKPTTVNEATIDFIVEKGRQPKPSEVLQIKEKLKPLIEKIGCPGLAAGGRAKFQDGSTCYTRGVEKIKTGKLATAAEKSNFSKLTKMTGGLKKLGSFLFGPVEMGVLPLFLAGEGAYGRYANEQDYRKALKREGVDPKAIDDLAEVYGRELADLGNVGLESYAIDQENIPQTREFLKATGVSPLEYQQFASEKVKEERRTQAKEYAAALEKAQKEKFDPTMPVFKKGGRVSFKLGGMGRRGFLKLLAALGLSGAAAGTGLIKLGGKAVGKKAAVKAGADIVAGTQGMPSWFPALVNKIIKEGDDVTEKLATMDRQVVHTKKLPDGEEVTVYRDIDTGDIRVEVDSVSNMGEAPIQLDYKAPSVIDEGKSVGKKTKSEFSAVESEPRVANPDGDIEFDGENIVGNVDDLFSDTTRVKNYAEGKKPTMKDIVTRKKKTDIVEEIHERPGEHINNKYGDGPDLDYDAYLPDIDDID